MASDRYEGDGMSQQAPHKEQVALYDERAEALVGKLTGMMSHSGSLSTRLQYEHAMRQAQLHALLHVGEKLDELLTALRRERAA